MKDKIGKIIQIIVTMAIVMFFIKADAGTNELESSYDEDYHEVYQEDVIEESYIDDTLNNTDEDASLESEYESAEDKFKRRTELSMQKSLEEKRIRDGEELNAREKLEAMQNGESLDSSNESMSENLSDEVYFLNNGYYYHKNMLCEGIKDCYDVKSGSESMVKKELNIKPCNWCVE